MPTDNKIRVGIGGWVFPPWRGSFYPAGLPQAQELAYASRQLTTIEINGTFYGRQKPESFRRWFDETPENFAFSLKGPRFATHRPDLAAAGPAIDRFLASGVLELGNKLGPILWQFPSTTSINESGLDAFLELLPRHMDGRALRHVVEIRRQSFPQASLIALLRRHQVAIALDDDLDLDDLTAEFLYARLRHCTLDEPAGYPPDRFDACAQRLLQWSIQSVSDGFVYFISGAKIRAPAAAQALLQRLTEPA